MKQTMIVLCTVLAIVAVPRFGAAQDDHAAKSPKAAVHLSSPLVVGQETLPPGDYEFQCKKIDGEDFLVTSDDGREVARVPCKPEILQDKVQVTDIRTVPSPNNSRLLSSVRIKGEKIAHRVATD